MNAIAIVQARMGSTRLPGKVLMPLAGRPVLDWVVRAARAVPGLDRTVVATSARSDDDAVANWCEQAEIDCHRGPHSDVLGRYAEVVRDTHPDIVMRLTADCPFLDPAVCDQVLALLRLTGSDYATNADPRRWPDGLDCEVFRAECLLEADAETTDPFDREHVTPYLRNMRHRYRAETLPCPLPGLGGERWTLDTSEDYERLCRVAEQLPAARPPAWTEILAVVRGWDAECPPRAADTLPEAPVQAPRRVAGTGHNTRGDGSADRYATSQRLFERAMRTIPTASQTFSKSHLQFPAGNAPLFLTHGRNGIVWDVDGNRYVDMICGLLPVVLGYCDSDVDDAIARQLSNGISFSLATELEAELAERLVSIIPCAEMVRFGKNGSDATSAAIRLARAFTGRDRIAVCGYHGWQDWYIGATTRDKGVPGAVKALTHKFAFNRLDSLDAVLAAHPNEFAAVMLEPMTTEDPADGFLAGVRDLAHAHGALFIFDEIVTGFRFALGGAQALFGITPDLASFGKAMGNGMPISAVVGRSDVMAEMDEIFFSGTFGGEALSLAAAIAVIDKMQREPVIERLWQTGADLAGRVRDEIEVRGLSGCIELLGKPSWTVLSIHDHAVAPAAEIKTMLRQELLKRGVLIGGSHNVCYAHSDTDVDHTVEAYRQALDRLADGLATGSLRACLDGPVIAPVFAVRT